jgi:hypothetical protein
MNRLSPHHLAIKSVTLLLLLSLASSLTWAQRECCEGDSWLKWSPERRDAYVVGYILGYYGGYTHGCEEGTKHATASQPGVENFPVNQCIDQRFDYTKGIDLSKDITKFYQRYPENRNLLIKEILEELGKGKSIEDIHGNPQFPTVKSSKNPPKAKSS